MPNFTPIQKLNPEFKTKWVQALRSGEFKQAKSSMRTQRPDANEQYGHCCLGVGAEIIKRAAFGIPFKWMYGNLCELITGEDGEGNKIQGWEQAASGAQYYHSVLQSSGLTTLDADKMNELAFAETSVVLFYEGTYNTAAYWNDEANLTFEQIADLVEEQL